MNTLTLHLKQAGGQVRRPAAWFLAGAEPAAWIEEICQLNVPHESLRLFLIPKSPTDRSVAGVLVVPSQSAMGLAPERAIPYGVIAGKLFLPVDAELSPPVESFELNLLHDFQVFHPGVGLVGFDAAAALRLSDLLRPPPSRVENWNLARPGAGFNTRLRAVTVSIATSTTEIYGDAGQDIGSEPIVDLPPSPDEPSDSALGRAWRDANGKFARFLSSAFQRPGVPGEGSSLGKNIADWAQARMGRLTDELQALRHKELNRLLHQLENDPELGLRHAIPLNRTHHRGLAPPGARLTRKNPDFNLGHLRGGTPADFWDIPAQLRQQLVLRYRELANRELQLGRYRRAAYIFAELLGDLESAASVLKQGRHFREAAVVYHEHLRRHREAALCLSEAGLFLDAIALYEKEALFLEAGDLYRRIDEPEKAAVAYRQEVKKLMWHQDRLGAAKLLEERLESPEQALAALAEGWPNSVQAVPCLDAQFSFFARHGRHADCLALLERLRDETTPPELICRLAGLLCIQSANYPDHHARRAAADLTRVKAAARLDDATPAEAVQLTDALVKLAVQDRLLTRDAIRFVALRNEQFRRRAAPALAPSREPVLVWQFQLPRRVRWQAVKSCAACFVAAGYDHANLALVRGNWDGKVQAMNWGWPDAGDSPILMEMDQSTARPASALLATESGRFPPLPVCTLPATQLFQWPMQAGRPDWLPDDVLSVFNRDCLSFLLRNTANGVVLECRRNDGTLVGNTSFDRISQALGGPFRRASILIQHELAWVAADHTLFLDRPGKPLQSWTVESAILSLVGSAPHLSLCALARLERGVAIQWLDAIRDRVETLCGELERPLAAFTGDGTLILLSGEEGRVCDVRRSMTRVDSFTWHGGEPLAVVRAGSANEFIVFTKTGEGHLFRVRQA